MEKTTIENSEQLRSEISAIKAQLADKKIIRKSMSLSQIPQAILDNTDMVGSVTKLGTRIFPSFANNTDIESITIGNDISAIPDECFQNCVNLTSVTIPTSVKSVGEDAFRNCNKLTIENVKTDYLKVGNSWIVIDNSLVNLQLPGFEQTTEITIPNSVTKIADAAFSGCEGLTEMTVLSSITEIGDLAFLNTPNLTEIFFPGFTAEQVAEKVYEWAIGVTYDREYGTIKTHTVICWCSASGDEPLIVNDNANSDEGTDIDWTKLQKLLENYPANIDKLPFEGSSLKVKYHLPSGTDIDTPFIVLGYNQSVPEYVKYKSGNDYVYLKTTGSDGLLLNEFTGSYLYNQSKSQTSITAREVSERKFTYGNNNPYSVPLTIIGSDDKAYSFCGYNMTLQSKYGLYFTNDQGNNSNYQRFDDNSNRYGDSKIRSVLNDDIYNRLVNSDMKNAITNVINRTWVHSSWRSGVTLDESNCEHTNDKIWLLGVGDVNCTGYESSSGYFQDAINDTANYLEVFKKRDDLYQSNQYRMKFLLDESGKPQSYTDSWWLRSAYSNSGLIVAYVGGYGGVSGDYYNGYIGVVPALTIG